MGNRAIKIVANRLAAWLLHRYTMFRVVAWFGNRETIAGIGISQFSKTYASPGRWVMIEKEANPVSTFGINYRQVEETDSAWVNLNRHDKAN